MKDGELDSLDFFYNGYFNAVIFYSDTEGRLLRSEVYAHGILAGDGITGTPGQGDSVLAAVIPEVLTPTSVSTLQNGITTRPNDWTETLNPIYVVASPPGNDDDTWISDDPDHPSNRRGQPEETKDYVIKPVGGGGTPNEITYRVNISIIGRGTATGAGTYNPMDIVTCTASPLSIGGTVTSSFVFWSGYVSSTEPTVTFLIMGDFLNRELKLSAVFHNLSPCADGGRTDPLMERQIRGSGYKGSNIKGGRFGNNVRKDSLGKPRGHNGIDLACPIGTPVFATTSGVVTSARTGFINGESWEDYKNRGGTHSYDKSIFNCGNAVDITSTVNGRKYVFKYWHLTSLDVAKGDSVKVGDIIGTSGITGNASSPGASASHLHFQVNAGGGGPVNPESFLYSIFDDSGKQTNPCY